MILLKLVGFEDSSVSYIEYDIDCEYIATLIGKYSQGQESASLTCVLKGSMLPRHILMFELVRKVFLPRFERRHEAVRRDLCLMETLDSHQHVNLLELMIKHMTRGPSKIWKREKIKVTMFIDHR